LKRIAIGPIRDSALKLGRWRELTAPEVERLRRSVQLHKGNLGP
jgi:16S rRNA U516 pseudouridylate synthase RsuA-like enzyme